MHLWDENIMHALYFVRFVCVLNLTWYIIHKVYGHISVLKYSPSVLQKGVLIPEHNIQRAFKKYWYDMHNEMDNSNPHSLTNHQSSC